MTSGVWSWDGRTTQALSLRRPRRDEACLVRWLLRRRAALTPGSCLRATNPHPNPSPSWRGAKAGKANLTPDPSPRAERGDRRDVWHVVVGLADNAGVVPTQTLVGTRPASSDGCCEEGQPSPPAPVPRATNPHPNPSPSWRGAKAGKRTSPPTPLRARRGEIAVTPGVWSWDGRTTQALSLRRPP